MKNTLMIAAIAGLVGGAIGSVAMKTLAGPEQVAANMASDSHAGLLPQAKGGNEALAAELAELKRANNELTLRMASLESRRAVATREEAAPEGNASLAELESTVAELAAALKNPQSASSAGLRQMVASAMEEVQTAKEDERQSEREQREVDRIVERMGEYTEKLGLDGVQKQSMQNVLIDASKKRNELFASMRDGGIPREDIRSAFTVQREDSEAALGRILSPAQLESYKEMNNDDRGGFFNGGGRGNARGGRGGGGGAAGN